MEEVIQIRPADVKVRKGWNVRNFDDAENREHVKDMARSIEANGILEPITVVLEGGKYVLVNGETRLRAVKLLQKSGKAPETIPARLDDPDRAEGERVADQFVRNSGKPFTPLEQSALFLRLRDLGWEDAQIAAHAGLVVERVRQIIALDVAPETVKAAIREGQVSSSMVQKVMQTTKDPVSVEATVSEAITRAKAEGRSKAGPRHIKPAPAPHQVPAPVEPLGTAEERAAAAESMVRTSAKALLGELLSYQDGNPKGRETVSVTFRMPRDRWERILIAGKK